MSPQITNVVLPHTASGKLKCCMVHTLRALRNSPRLLLNTMDVFVKEPSLDWKVGQSTMHECVMHVVVVDPPTADQVLSMHACWP